MTMPLPEPMPVVDPDLLGSIEAEVAAFARRVARRNLNDDQLVTLFLERARNRSANTFRTYEQGIRRFRSWFGREVARVRYEDLLTYQATPAPEGGLRGLAPATQVRHLMTLKAFFNLAVDLKYLQDNPAKLLQTPAAPARPQPFLTPEDMARMILHAGAAIAGAKGPWGKLQARRNHVLVVMACTTACRCAELADSRWGDLYRDPRGNICLRIRGKGGKSRDVKILPAVWNLLRNHRESMGLSPKLSTDDPTPLFVNREGDRLSEMGIARAIGAAAKAAGIEMPVTPHAARRGVATAALLGGAPRRQVQAQLGHASLNTTQRYLYDLEGLQETAADHLGIITLAIAGAGAPPAGGGSC